MIQIPPRYLARIAIVYVRQSTDQQVLHNQGSRHYQEAQVEVARRFGWRRDMIRVVTQDLGMSGRRADRPGYLETLELIRLDQVGAVFVSDLSRAARVETMSFDLLGLLIKHDVLLIKNGVIVDPNDPSQMFVAKIETVVIARENEMRVANMHRGRLANADLGKPVSAPTIGYEVQYEIVDGNPAKTGAWIKDRNPKIRHAIDAVFQAFDEGGSLRKAVDLLNAWGIELPARKGNPSRKTKDRIEDGIRWVRPTVPGVRRFIRHPAYAGIYVYGTKHWRRVCAGGEPAPQARLIGQFVEKPDHHEGYITVEHYHENQRRLALNAKGPGQSQAGPGPALLQGRCACGRHGAMVVHYFDRANGGRGWSFRCLGDYLVGGEQCVSIPGVVLEQAVVSAVWDSIDVPTVKEAERLWRAAKTKWGQQNHGLQVELDRKLKARDRIRLRALEDDDTAFPRYKAMLAHEYEQLDTQVERLRQRIAREEVAVDPFNEVRWSELKALCADVKAIWNATTTTDLDRKQLIRLLVEKVVIDAVDPEKIHLHIEWTDGTPHKRIELLRSPYFHRLMWQWHRAGASAETIVDRLKDLGARTQQGHAWSLATVKKTLSILAKRSPESDANDASAERSRPWPVMLELESAGLRPQEIADRLNADGLLTRFHTSWSASSVQRVLRAKQARRSDTSVSGDENA
jgi:DNA invertase Pin-like site-specific DNA recombinase